MIRALLLIFDPSRTWEKIEAEKRSFLSVLFLHVLPLVALTTAAEAWGFMNLGKDRGTLVEKIAKISPTITFRYEMCQVALTLIFLFFGALALRGLGASFHRKHTYTECFSTLAYSLSPVLLCRLFNIWPPMNFWASWAIGIVLGVAQLYRGVPRVMKPDPSNALGLYTITMILMIAITGFGQYLLLLVLSEKLLGNF